MVLVALIAQKMNAAVRIDTGAVEPPGCVEVGIHLLLVRQRACR